MFIRFLSYAASIIGAKRYKPLLISCLALVFSITGISIVVSSFTSDSSDAASKVGKTATNTNNGQQQSTSLNGLEQKQTKDDNANVQPQNNQSNPNKDDKQNASSSQNSTTLSITLNTATVSLSQTSPNSAVTVNTDDNSTVQWSIAPSPESANSGVNARIEPVKDNISNAVIRFRTDTITPGTYQFVVTAKDTARNLSTSKTITVTVN